MTIIKTLLLQAFLLLAFLGASQAQSDNTPAPEIEATQEGNKVDADKVVCGKALKLKCKATQVAALAVIEKMKFQKDGQDLEKSDPWKDVTKGSGPLPEDTLVKELSTGAMDASYFGTYTCLSSKDGVQETAGSNEFKITCKACKENKTCTANTEHGKHSYCKDDECACTVFTGSIVDGGDKYGECKECNTDSSAGCGGKKPMCNQDKSTCESCKTHGGCGVDETCKEDGSCEATPSGGDKSSAGTVTSTACLVIASVVVALMN